MTELVQQANVLVVITSEQLVVDHRCPWFGLTGVKNTVKPFHFFKTAFEWASDNVSSLIARQLFYKLVRNLSAFLKAIDFLQLVHLPNPHFLRRN